MSITRNRVITRPRADFESPLGNSPDGKLVILSGVPRLTIDSDASMPHLVRANFESPRPHASVRNGVVRIRYPSYSIFNLLIYWRQPQASITINALIPWSIDVQGGVSGLDADLSQVKLSSLEIRGGVGHLRASLPTPDSTIPIRIGTISNLTIHRPATTPVRIQARSGIGSLLLDEQNFGAMAGQHRFETEGFYETTNRYDIQILGGAGSISIDQKNFAPAGAKVLQV
jgi:hypothetical protein